MNTFKIAFIATEDYSCSRISQAVSRLGHNLIHIKPDEISVCVDKNEVVLIVNGKKLDADGIIHKMSTDFRDGLACLESVLEQYVILNKPEATLRSANKFLTSAALSKNFIPKPDSTFVLGNEPDKEMLGKYKFPMVIKQPDGSEGNEVGLASKKEDLPGVLNEIRRRGNAVVFQEYISECFGEDLRIIVVGGKVVAAMKRIQTDPKEFRANIHKGAIGHTVVLTKDEETIAVKAVDAVGLDFAGVDILRSNRGPLVLETNSFPGLQGIESTTGIDVAESIVGLMIKKLDDHYSKNELNKRDLEEISKISILAKS